ncbi:MAG: hypothetical protein Q4B09_00450 [Lachnospiraceae bacterium]|nr:hypothetical protein [Lachnospiraceae bacterium]
MNTFYYLMVTVGVIGVVISEILLVIAMLKPNDRITTRMAGKLIVFFFLLLTVSVTVTMFLNKFA